MSSYITLLGAEKVENAARSMNTAAETIRQSVGNLDGILHRHRLWMDEWMYRMEALKGEQNVHSNNRDT